MLETTLSILIPTIVIIGGIVIATFLLRAVWLWFFRINEAINLLTEIKNILKDKK